MLACSFLIESSSKLLVTRTGMKARSSSILGRIRPLSLELLALEWQEFHTFELELSLKPVGQSWSNFMCSITGVGERLHKVLGQIDLAHWTQVSDRCPLGYLFFFCFVILFMWHVCVLSLICLFIISGELDALHQLSVKKDPLELQHSKPKNNRRCFIESVHERQWHMRHPSRRLAPSWALLLSNKCWTVQSQRTRKC